MRTNADTKLCLRLFLSAFCAFMLAGCSSATLHREAPTSVENQSPSRTGQDKQAVGQDQLLQAQAARAEKVEVLFSARVRKLLPEDTRGLPHQLFLLDLDNGTTVKVAHDTKYAPHVPIQPGDQVTIKGEYIWNRRGGVVHWTHRSDTPRHEGGYIDFNGARYE